MVKFKQFFSNFYKLILGGFIFANVKIAMLFLKGLSYFVKKYNLIINKTDVNKSTTSFDDRQNLSSLFQHDAEDYFDFNTSWSKKSAFTKTQEELPHLNLNEQKYEDLTNLDYLSGTNKAKQRTNIGINKEMAKDLNKLFDFFKLKTKNMRYFDMVIFKENFLKEAKILNFELNIDQLSPILIDYMVDYKRANGLHSLNDNYFFSKNNEDCLME